MRTTWIIFALTVSLCACGSGEGESQPAAQSTADTPPATPEPAPEPEAPAPLPPAEPTAIEVPTERGERNGYGVENIDLDESTCELEDESVGNAIEELLGSLEACCTAALGERNHAGGFVSVSMKLKNGASSDVTVQHNGLDEAFGECAAALTKEWPADAFGTDEAGGTCDGHVVVTEVLHCFPEG